MRTTSAALVALALAGAASADAHTRRFGNKRHRATRMGEAHARAAATLAERDTCTLGNWKCVGSELQRCYNDQWNDVANCTGDNIVCSDDPVAIGCIYTWQVPGESSSSSAVSIDPASSSAAVASSASVSVSGVSGTFVGATPTTGSLSATSVPLSYSMTSTPSDGATAADTLIAVTAAGTVTAASPAAATAMTGATSPATLSVSATGASATADASSTACPSGDDEYEWVEVNDDEDDAATADASSTACPSGDDEYEWVEVDDDEDEPSCDDDDSDDADGDATASVDSSSDDSASSISVTDSATATASSASPDASTTALGGDLYAGAKSHSASSSSTAFYSQATASIFTAGSDSMSAVTDTASATATSDAASAVVSSYKHKGKWTTTTLSGSATDADATAPVTGGSTSAVSTGSGKGSATASGASGSATGSATNATATGSAANATTTGSGAGGIGKFSAPHYVIYADEWLNSMPSASSLAGFNRFILSFWMTSSGAVDDVQAWTGFDADTRQSVLDEYHAAGIALMVSAFGSTDTPTSNGADPTSTAQQLAAFVKQWGLDGVDIDYEDMDAMNNNKAEAWLVTFQTELRNQLGSDYLISHAPVAPWFTSASVYSSGAYVEIFKQVGDTIDFFNVQFYNQGSDMYTDCDGLMTQSGSDWPSTSVMEINSYAGVPLDKIVLGKPLDAAAADNGFIDAATLATCVAQGTAKGWNGGVMFWEWVETEAQSMIGTVLGS